MTLSAIAGVPTNPSTYPSWHIYSCHPQHSWHSAILASSAIPGACHSFRSGNPLQAWGPCHSWHPQQFLGFRCHCWKHLSFVSLKTLGKCIAFWGLVALFCIFGYVDRRKKNGIDANCWNCGICQLGTTNKKDLLARGSCVFSVAPCVLFHCCFCTFSFSKWGDLSLSKTRTCGSRGGMRFLEQGLENIRKLKID